MDEQEVIGIAISKIQSNQVETARTLLLDQAKNFPNSPVINNLLGACYSNLQEHQTAVKHYMKAIKLSPKYSDPYNNISVSLIELDQNLEAIKNLQIALQLNPDYVDALYNYSTALKNIGERDKTKQALNRLLQLVPTHSKGLNNLALLHLEEGSLESASKCLDRALIESPKSCDILLNKAMVLRFQEQNLRALDFLNRAAKYGADATKVTMSLSAIYEQQGNQTSALAVIVEALKKDSSNVLLLSQYGRLIVHKMFNEYSVDDAKILANILEAQTITRSKLLTIPVVSLLRCLDLFNELLKFNSRVGINDIELLSKDKLLNSFLRRTPVADLGFEHLFGKLRRYFLFNFDSISENIRDDTVLVSLAMQCFLNEYIYIETDAEKSKLKNFTAPTSINSRLDVLRLYIYTLYRPISRTMRDQLLNSNLQLLDKQFSQLTILEPSTEDDLLAGLSLIEGAKNPISSLVQAQYEQHPYPRWRSIGLRPVSASLKQLVSELNLSCNLDELTSVPKPQVLIAGCGTGQQSIEASSRYKNADIMAIDLSKASLAYAVRMTNELQISNISYFQADILNIASIKNKFDVIECMGVLHHMSKPGDGLAILKKLLLPGGLMRLGLYSAKARQDITELRTYIKQKGFTAEAGSPSEFRHKLINLNHPLLKSLSQTTDFYSTSELIDLIFHVQEHQFDLDQIETLLTNNGLKFIGFEGKTLPKRFYDENPNFKTYDLSHWKLIENKFPMLFRGMYQFWCESIVK